MIVPTLARLLVREHLYKPIEGKVLALGRQTIAMTYEEVTELLQQENYTPPKGVFQGITADQDQTTRVGKGTNYITDEVFFSLFGVKEMLTMDVSTYEATDILHDLNKPVPDTLHNQFDFIIDGGTFDHLLDIRTAFENVVRMLKPGGRIFQWNAASNATGAAYISYGPDLFYDYYVLNQFVDCKVYIAEVTHFGQREKWDFYEFQGTDKYSHFPSNRIQVVIVLAEKGESSSWDKMPVQSQYRDENLWQPYRNAQKVISSSNRKAWTGSRSGRKLTKTKNQQVKPKMSVMSKVLARLKERGLLWCIRRFFSKTIQKGNRHEGFKYLGKI